MNNINETAVVAASKLKEVLGILCNHPKLFNSTDSDNDLYEAIGHASISLEILEILASENPLNRDLLLEAIETVNNHTATFQSFLEKT